VPTRVRGGTRTSSRSSCAALGDWRTFGDMLNRMLAFVVFAVATVSLAMPAWADVEPAAVWSDRMVIQRDQPVIVWGRADAGEKVTVTVNDASRTVRADSRGRWRLTCEPLTQVGPCRVVIAGKNRIELKDVLVGEVWVCSGQSNMQWPVARSGQLDEALAAADRPTLRLLTVPRAAMREPQESFKGTWQLCTPETVKQFSAVAFQFGKHLSDVLEVPIGLINTSYGGTPAEAWAERSALRKERSLAPLLSQWDKRIEAFDPEKAKKQHAKNLVRWQAAVKKAKEDGKKPPRRPRAPVDPGRSPHSPSGLYNAMIAPLVPFGMRGVIWYQGESNAGRAFQYRTLFPTMIRSWHDSWKRDAFPFYFVQLANFKAIQQDPKESAWAELREAQLQTLANVPKTGMAVIIDIGAAGNIHPPNKHDVGKRLALWALAKDYGRDVAYSGPLYRSMKKDRKQIRIRLDHTDGGLTTRNAEPLKGFAVAGKDRRFVWAQARIEGDEIVVWSPDVKHPVAVRYAWADNPACNLTNAAGLPASPFRTDDWPGVTGGP